jgi:hypothetical protein
MKGTLEHFRLQRGLTFQVLSFTLLLQFGRNIFFTQSVFVLVTMRILFLEKGILNATTSTHLEIS